jgi:hypothetical protein
MTPPVPAAASADASSFSSASEMISSILDAPSPEPNETQEAPAPPAEPESGEPLEQEQQDGEQAEAAADDDQQIADDVDAEDEFVEEDGRKRYHVKPERMRKFIADKNFVNQLADFAPTIEDARAHFEASSDFRALQSDFASGEPDGIQRFMGFWAEGAPEAFQSMATQLPAYLANLAAQNNSGALQALNAIESQVHRATVGRLYDKAAQTKDPKDLYAAQAIDFALNGKYHETLDKIPARQQPQPQDQLRQREQQFQRQQDAFASQRWNEFDSSALTGAMDQSLKGEIDKAFKAAEGAFTPGLLSAAKREAAAQVTAELQKQFEWNRNQKVELGDIQRDFLRAVKSGQKTDLEPRAAALVGNYKSRIARILPGIVKPLIGENTRAVMQQSSQAHARLASGATKTAPGAGGRPVPRHVVQPKNWATAAEGLNDLLG